MPLNALTHPMHQFVLVILQVKVKKSYLVWKEKMSRHTGPGGGCVQRNVTECHQGGGGSKKCEKSVTYYLNGPLAKIAEFLDRQGSFDQDFGPLSFYFQNFGPLVKNGRFSLRPTEINLWLKNF
jgi:hypothetical protein